MGAGASAVGAAKGKSAEEIATGVQALNAKDKAILKAALEANLGGDSASIAENVKSISENEAAIHELSLTVMKNKQGIFEARSMMEENRANIVQNYQAATTGNRQMAMENTDAIYRNRYAILDALKTNGAVEENFRNSKWNESTVEVLENQCLLNNRVAKVNGLMAAANADMIAANEAILKSNEEMVEFNKQQREKNLLLMQGIPADQATPEANAARIAANKEKIQKFKERNDKYNEDMAKVHSDIKENRKSIEENAGIIKERRKQILDNRKTIDENGKTVAELLKVENFADTAKAMDDLSEEEKKNIQAALEGGAETDEVKANRAQIIENDAMLHELHFTVSANKSKLLAVRSIIEENRFLLMKNYAAAFAGNRLMINQNTDNIFKNRMAILDALKVEGQVQENFRNTMYNEANIEFLEHRSLINNRVAKTNKMMAEANKKMIEANSGVLKSNEEIVKFNTAAIATNKNLLEGIQPEKATSESNKARITKNSEGIKMIQDHGAKYDEKVEEATKAALENRKKIIANSKDIDERRKKILETRTGIIELSLEVAKKIREQ